MEEGDVLADISAMDSTALVRRHHGMDDLTQLLHQCPRSDLIVYVKQCDRTPVFQVQTISLFERGGDKTSALKQERRDRIEGRCQGENEIST